MTDPGKDRVVLCSSAPSTDFEGVIFTSRWLMAPFYLGLIVSLAVLLFKFLYEFITHAWGASELDIILGVLSLIDLSLTGNLVLIVVFSGYEELRIAHRPGWPSRLAGMDDADRFRRAEAEGIGVDRRHFRYPGAQGIHEYRFKVNNEKLASSAFTSYL